MRFSKKLDEIKFNKSRGEKPRKPHLALNENGDMAYVPSTSASLNGAAYKHLKKVFGKGLITPTNFTG